MKSFVKPQLVSLVTAFVFLSLAHFQIAYFRTVCSEQHSYCLIVEKGGKLLVILLACVPNEAFCIVSLRVKV